MLWLAIRRNGPPYGIRLFFYKPVKLLRAKKSLSKAAGIKSGDRKAPKGKESLQAALPAAGEGEREWVHHMDESAWA
jgi:hypothetical protein